MRGGPWPNHALIRCCDLYTFRVHWPLPWSSLLLRRAVRSTPAGNSWAPRAAAPRAAVARPAAARAHRLVRRRLDHMAAPRRRRATTTSSSASSSSSSTTAASSSSSSAATCERRARPATAPVGELDVRQLRCQRRRPTARPATAPENGPAGHPPSSDSARATAAPRWVEPVQPRGACPSGIGHNPGTNDCSLRGYRPTITSDGNCDGLPGGLVGESLGNNTFTEAMVTLPLAPGPRSRAARRPLRCRPYAHPGPPCTVSSVVACTGGICVASIGQRRGVHRGDGRPAPTPPGATSSTT